MAAPSPHRYVISVLIADRVAVLRDITSAVADLGGNIAGISQTVVAGYFTVILTASFTHPHTCESLRSAILDNFKGNEASIIVIPYDTQRASRHPVRGDRYIVTIAGTDRPGILKAVTTFLAEKGINVEDWHVAFEEDGVVHIGEITIPRLLDLKQVQDELHQILAPTGLVTCIQHENIFRVTNEVGAIGRMLLEEQSHAQAE